MHTSGIMGTEPLHVLCAAVASLSIVGVGCGRVVPEEVPPPSDVFTPIPAAAVEGASSLGPTRAVPAGITTLGQSFVDEEARLRVLPCGPNSRTTSPLGRTRVVVGAFRLSEHETTNAAYAECVGAGRCPPPPEGSTASDPSPGPWNAAAKATLPVALPYKLARAFCRARGGDLPTLGQMRRAMTGSDDGFGIPQLSNDLVACGHRGQNLPRCNAILRDGPYLINRVGESYRPLHPVGTLDWDVGPYGHRDLFGNAAEWVRGFTPVCPATDEILTEADAYGVVLDRDPGRVTALHPAQALLFDRGGFPWPKGNVDVVTDGPELYTDKSDYFTGFRCAFPPEAK